jgi:hypothetical protein
MTKTNDAFPPKRMAYLWWPMSRLYLRQLRSACRRSLCVARWQQQDSYTRHTPQDAAKSRLSGGLAQEDSLRASSYCREQLIDAGCSLEPRCQVASLFSPNAVLSANKWLSSVFLAAFCAIPQVKWNCRRQHGILSEWAKDIHHTLVI